MELTKKTLSFVADSGHEIRITCYREKFALCDLWRVDYAHKYNGVTYWFNYKKDLFRKPERRQIERYLAIL